MANSIIRHKILISCLIAFLLVSTSFADNMDKRTIVAPKGDTTVQKAFKKNVLYVTISTHEVDIGKPSDEFPEMRNNSCTYSRYPCSLVDRIDIRIDDKRIFVPRSVYSDLADINTVNVTKRNGLYVITLEGGDASESYSAIIKLNRDMIVSRELWDGESGRKLQETKYLKVVT